ncbi:MAG: GxxExxY protein [Alphaproteobacteria bacterium]|nr:GxxExxY protein [Alphaproteobacteria bacterium]
MAQGHAPTALDVLSGRVLQASFRVHTALGPGLLESAYVACLEHELHRADLFVERQRVLPVRYGDVFVDAGYRVDLLVERTLIVEVKAARNFTPIHEAQLLTYLKLAELHLGLLLNFNVRRLADGGIRRVVHGRPPE